MSTVTIRNLPEEVHRALKMRAALAGRSTEDELRFIISEAVMPRANLADAMVAISQSFGGFNLDSARDKRRFKPPVIA